MLKHVEMDVRQTLAAQFQDLSDDPVILINLFDVDPKDAELFKRAWAEDAAFFKRQPGYISAQLHHGIGNSSMWLNYAVFESARAFGETTRQPEFKPLRGIYPDSATAHPNLFRRVRIPGICTG
jgi:heme-degrading monooxygenase HmoA